MKNPHLKSRKFNWVIVTVLMTGCGGGGGSGSGIPSDVSQPDSLNERIGNLPPVTVPDQTAEILPVPDKIASGSTVKLQCGYVYRGTLNVAGKSDVTVTTTGTCGKATITPGEAVKGWQPYQGNIWVAPVSFNPAQLLIDAQPVSAAHWPNKAQTWATANSSSANNLNYAMPNGDLNGATLVFRQYDWTIEARTITGYSGNTISFTSTGKAAFDDRAPSGAVKFYVEGKLWMLDEPGEWAYSDGKLYVWTPDGQSPEGRAWASPDASGIDATQSKNISVDGIRIYGAANGINAESATGLKVSNTDIVNSSENGINNTGGSGLNVDKTGIRNTRHDAVVVKWGGGNESITNSRIDTTGVSGMPSNSHGAITLTLSSGATVQNNTVSNSGYIGVRVFRNSAVIGNTIEASCQVMTDCGGIYVSSPDLQALNTRIESNLIKNTSPSQRLSWGVQLDEGSNGVTVASNVFNGNSNGIMLFNAFNINIQGNTFSESSQAHIQMAESVSSRVRNNTVAGNQFATDSNEESYRLSSDLGASAVTQFGSYYNNTYKSTSSVFANFNGEQINFTQWKTKTGQDSTSTYSAP